MPILRRTIIQQLSRQQQHSQHTLNHYRKSIRISQQDAIVSSFSTQKSNGRSLVVKGNNAVAVSLDNPWKEVKDPNGSSLVYYWNPHTNQTTPLGYPKPQYWVEVQDPNGSTLTYWWNPETDQTTALGSPNPADLTPVPQSTGNNSLNNVNARPFTPYQPPQTLGGTMKVYFLWGVGMTFAFAFVRALIG